MRKTFRSVLTFVATSLFIANASAATVWYTTDVAETGNVNILQIDALGLTLNGGTLALFEDAAAIQTLDSGLILGSAGGRFEFNENFDGSYTVTSVVGDISQDSIVIGGNQFVLAVNWGSGYVSDSAVTQNAADPTSYLIDFDDGINTGTTLAVDVSEVPLPAAFWLFGAALLGLMPLQRSAMR